MTEKMRKDKVSGWKRERRDVNIEYEIVKGNSFPNIVYGFMTLKLGSS